MSCVRLLAERHEPPAGAPDLFGTASPGEILSFPYSAGKNGRCPRSVLAALLALNEEMVQQLHAERLSAAGTADFALRMIAQHERSAVLLRIRLATRGIEPG